MRKAILGFFAALAAVGCSDTPPATVNYNQTGGSAATSGGSGNTSGGSAGNTSGSGGSASGAGGIASTGGAGGAGGSAGAAGGTAGSAGSGGGDDPTVVKASTGCNKAPPVGLNAWVEQQIFVAAEKADFTRKYYVRLPETYDQNKPYRIIYQGPGCTGLGFHVYPFQNVSNGDAIQIGLEPQPGVWENNCFDDKEGDDSIEWPFFEAVHTVLKDTLCIDENRVFASGNSSGAWLGNEFACKYAKTIIRGIAVNTGGLPADQAERPTCNTEPFAGFWIHDAEDEVNVFAGNQYAIERAIQVNGCQTTFDAERDPYPITVGNVPDGRQICEKFRGCPANYPIVLCTSHGQNHGGQDDLAIPAMWQFMSSF